MLRNINRISCFNPFLINLNAKHLSGKSKGGCSRQIFNHFEKSGQVSNLDLFPSDLKRVAVGKFPHIYVANKEISEKIAQYITKFHHNDVPLFELNPGPCLLSSALLSHLNPKTLILVEKSEEFLSIQHRLVNEYKPNLQLKKVSETKYYSMLAKIVSEHCDERPWHDDIVCQIFMYSKADDINRLFTDVIKQKRMFSNGRAEIFALIPPFEFLGLTAKPDSKYWLYTQRSCLFQILFDYELLDKIPKVNFLPWHNSKPAYGGKVEYDTDSVYFVRMVPKQNLFSLCNRDDLPLLRFFIYQCLFKRRSYIISKLEKWIPGIGLELILSKFKQLKPNSQSHPMENNLLSCLPDTFHAFTESGSLTPIQFCALFQYFRQLPEYENSCFHQQCHEFYTMKPNKSLDALEHALHEDDDGGGNDTSVSIDKSQMVPNLKN